ncbi:tyrosine-type recombinase/integrase [Paracholeplasma manati]|uniref:tyrosine-type recombinase/integrase n=1 Tax=Paracholeplasma manati TaxID=591373 RepID=UPI00240842BF|nr:tyrosine-type recombinase/integrase [Paracholeplasma manati]MDG0888787.1 tyrosine-type recombinase/integrase [Paracholeplasma manati]
MRINELVLNQLKYVKLTHSEGTYKHYESHLVHFEKWCHQHGNEFVSDITDMALIDYITDLKKSCANITINKKVGILKRTFVTSGITHEYLMNIKKFKEKTTTFEMVDIELLKAIRKHALSLHDVFNNLTIKCTMLLLIDTGCRVNELIHIEKKNVNLDAQEILLTTTKTKENRVVYIHTDTANELKKMMAIKSNHKYLLHHITLNRPLNYFDVDWLMKHYRKVMGVDKLHAHMFRHSLASILLEHGADIKSVQDILGHRNLETTQRYIHSQKSHVKKTFFSSFDLNQ